MVHLDNSIGTVAPYTANRRRKPCSRLTLHSLPSYLERFDLGFRPFTTLGAFLITPFFRRVS